MLERYWVGLFTRMRKVGSTLEEIREVESDGAKCVFYHKFAVEIKEGTIIRYDRIHLADKHWWKDSYKVR